jgi:hypothetical protein
MKDEDRTELLAQAIWRGQFGLTTIDPRWAQYVTDNPTEANQLRAKATEMLSASKNMAGNHSLDWLQ